MYYRFLYIGFPTTIKDFVYCPDKIVIDNNRQVISRPYKIQLPTGQRFVQVKENLENNGRIQDTNDNNSNPSMVIDIDLSIVDTIIYLVCQLEQDIQDRIVKWKVIWMVGIIFL